MDCGASDINDEMKLAAAEAIASAVSDEKRNEQYIIPDAFDVNVVEYIRKAVIEAAVRTGVARTVQATEA
ncbi:NAD-dependent malic enzyme [compost metagenome]